MQTGIFGKSALCLLVMILAFFLTVCEKGNQPVGPLNEADSTLNPSALDTVVWQNGQVHLIADPSRLRAAFGDTAGITVMAYDNNRNPVSGKTVTFWASVGMITPASAVTNVNGIATAKFSSVPSNSEALIMANFHLNADSIVQQSTSITLSGLEVQVLPSAYQVLVNNVVPVSFHVVDASGKPVSNDTLFLSNGVTDTLVTLGDGTISTSLTSAVEGSKTIVAVSRKGARDSAVVRFWTVIPDTATEPQNQIRQMRIYSSRSQLNADNSDFAKITVILIDENNNPAKGDTIKFTSDLGIIGKTAVVDSTGRATVTLQSAPINGTCTIRAVAPSTNDTASTQVLFGGISLHLTSDPTSLKIGTYALLEALLRNASNTPIGGDMVTFTVSGGAAFEGGNTLAHVSLNPEGKAQIRLTSASACTAMVRATTLNTRDSVEVVFTNNALSLTVTKPVILIGGTDSTVITATYVNGSNQPQANIPIHFAANAGTIRTANVVTDVNGRAATVLVSANFAANATVQASASDASITATVEFSATVPASVLLTVTPDNIRVNGGVATLIATVLDAQGNRVTGADVNFKLLEGPGGGEYIEKPLVVSKDGEAQTKFFSGAVPSQLLGIKIAAYASGFGDTTKLTISGLPYAVSVARPQDDTIKVDDAGRIDSSVFDYFVGAVVKDINGNPVADGTEVHFSAVVAGMAVRIKTLNHWQTPVTGGLVTPVYAYPVMLVPFEDLNNNLTMDPGVDLTLDFADAVASRGDDVNGDGVCNYNPLVYDFWWDFNGNGRCDPGTGEPFYSDPLGRVDSSVYADLNSNGVRDSSELQIDHNSNGLCDLPASGDFRFSLWEAMSSIFSSNFRFEDNAYSVVIDNSAVTKGGVAAVRLTYPRQYARKLFVLADAECQGVRDRHAEPFMLAVIVK